MSLIFSFVCVHSFAVCPVSSSDVFLGDRVPCFTALRVRVFIECLHAYALNVFLGKSREHVFRKVL